jgi:hypothetical protein
MALKPLIAEIVRATITALGTDRARLDGQTEPLLLLPRDAAQTLAISERTLWEHSVKRGDIPCVRIGTAIRYSPEDLRAWIHENKTAAQQAPPRSRRPKRNRRQRRDVEASPNGTVKDEPSSSPA